jgi:Protein of unknown function (DUF2970)
MGANTMTERRRTGNKPDQPVKVTALNDQPALLRQASIVETFKAVASSFFGVRGRVAHERDLAKLNPLHLIFAGLVMAALFIFTLLAVVRAVMT